jgi:hypothetical protein
MQGVLDDQTADFRQHQTNALDVDGAIRHLFQVVPIVTTQVRPAHVTRSPDASSHLTCVTGRGLRLLSFSLHSDRRDLIEHHDSSPFRR